MPHTKPIGVVNIISIGPFQLEIPAIYASIPPPITLTSAPTMHPTAANQSPYPAMFLSGVTICHIPLYR